MCNDYVWECGKLRLGIMVLMYVLIPSLTLWGGILVRMLVMEWYIGVVLSHSSGGSSTALHVNVCGSTQCCGCIVNGTVAMGAVYVMLNDCIFFHTGVSTGCSLGLSP